MKSTLWDTYHFYNSTMQTIGATFSSCSVISRSDTCNFSNSTNAQLSLNQSSGIRYFIENVITDPDY